MPPDWLRTLAAIYVPLSLLSTALVLADIFLLGRRQPMRIMEAVWPLTMLYWGPVGLLFYVAFGRGAQHGGKPMWQSTFTGCCHCGAGCALGDIIGDWAVFLLGFTLFGSELLGKYLWAFVLAYLFGIAFQYFSVAPMQKLGVAAGIRKALQIDTLSIVAYQIGMFAWMAVRARLFPALLPTSWAYWLMMQVAMLLGFATTYPVNWWLIRRGTKEAM